ncbi:MAG: SBBP repeat-containing protein [Bacteroidetes bacterium]|nr:SBBP repeat-containing protein [Bacteroidota bacterium]
MQGSSQSPSWAWAKSACSLSAATSITSITTDPSGNIFIAGNFRDSAMFGTTVFHPVGTANLFLAKYDSMGNYIWMQQAKGANSPPYDLITAICTDSSGNCYVTGFFNGVAIFSHDTIASTGPLPDVFIAKYNTNGNVVWLKKGFGQGSDYGNGIGLDADGNCYISGSFEQNISFGSISLLANNSSNDVFIAKLDPAGNFISAHSAGGSSVDQVNALNVDLYGNCFVAGTFNSPQIVFGNDTLNYTNTGMDAFISKFDSSGMALWGRAGSGPGNQEPSGIASDLNGNCYTTGIFKGDTMFLDTTTLVTYGYYDFFTSIHDASGNQLWAGHQGSATFGTENCNAITTDTSGNFYTTGQFRNPATFDTIAVTSVGAVDVFISKFNASGNAEWVQTSGTASNTLTSSALHRDQNGNLFITGTYEQNTTFGNDSLLISPGYYAGYYIAKLGTLNTTGVQIPNTNFSAIQIFPNPASDKLHIAGLNGKANIVVYDMTGSKVLEIVSFENQTLDIGNFKPGIYFLQINTKGEFVQNKFIKL